LPGGDQAALGFAFGAMSPAKHAQPPGGAQLLRQFYVVASSLARDLCYDVHD